MPKCPKCGYENEDPDVIKDCSKLPVPTQCFVEGDRVSAYVNRVGTIIGTKIRRYGGNHDVKRHIRMYRVRFDSPVGGWFGSQTYEKWLSARALEKAQ